MGMAETKNSAPLKVDRAAIGNRRLASVLVLLMAALAPAAAQETGALTPRVARLRVVEGSVQITRAGQQAAQTAVINLPLEQGDTLATGTGRAEIEFENGAVARLDANSALQLTLLNSANGLRMVRLTLTQGTGNFSARPALADVQQVFANGVQISFREQAEFRVGIDSAGTSVSVVQGAILITSGGLPRQVHKDQTLLFRAADQNVSLSGPPSEDEFDQWVISRNTFMFPAITAAVRYIPPQSTIPEANSVQAMAPDSIYGAADLYNYGSWQFFPGHGWGWQPNGIGPGWWPFSNGNWSFSNNLGFVWISNEPWGWMPYHFGGWVYGPQGWLWIPGQLTAFKPAAASWIRIGNDFGWVPLAPGDRAGKTPANLRYGALVTQGTGLTNAQAVSQPGTYKTMRIPHVSGAQAVGQPPATMASQLAPPLAPAIRAPEFPQRAPSAAPGLPSPSAGLPFSRLQLFPGTYRPQLVSPFVQPLRMPAFMPGARAGTNPGAGPVLPQPHVPSRPQFAPPSAPSSPRPVGEPIRGVHSQSAPASSHAPSANQR
jgi:hypothetical protein